jgi:hypothetical protein
VRRIYDRARDKTLAEEKARKLLPGIHAWHQWFYRARDPQGTGLVALLHPWESGRDNSADWDAAFDRVPTEGVGHFVRRDTTHANPAHRPTDEQYKRYIWLVKTFRSLGWDNTKLHEASPFKVVDPGFNAILIRACEDVADLASRLGMDKIASESRAMAAKGTASLETLWNERMGQYVCYDRAVGTLIESPTIGGILAAFAPIPRHRAAALVRRIETLEKSCNYLIPSHDPTHAAFDGPCYWRGPVWLIVNYMVADGLARAGQTEIVPRIIGDCLRLIETSGFAEYHDPITAEPCGGPHFTWTAAMVIEILNTYEMAA